MSHILMLYSTTPPVKYTVFFFYRVDVQIILCTGDVFVLLRTRIIREKSTSNKHGWKSKGSATANTQVHRTLNV